jgi:2-oxoglutarate ferredoxin oxidoreductase subunit alpha
LATEVTIGMAGAGGDGIVSAGESLMRAAALGGYNAIMTKSFGSQIRGGESSCRLRISTGPLLNVGGALDVALALNWDDFLRFGAELPVSGNTTVVYEAQTTVEGLPLVAVRPAEGLAVPFAALAREAAGTEKAKNAVVLGLLSRWLGLSGELLLEGIARKLQKKGPGVLAANARAFEAGIRFAGDHPLAALPRLDVPLRPGEAKLVADGNEICAAAAIFAGCEFFAGYPITPSSEIMQFLGREIWRYGGTVLQCEDEIASVGAALGASYAGKKALTATSGPGMSLKTEMLGLATIAELPLVCVNVQRGGPSTGIPTKSEQADLFQAVFSAHGDAPRPVLAPASVEDTFRTTVEAFNIAEELQTPVILLSDQDLAQRKETFDPIDTSSLRVVERRQPTGWELENYSRFRDTDSGVSPMSHPGLKGGNYLAGGIEHTEAGVPTASGEVHARMNQKRMRKLVSLGGRRDLFDLEGDPDAPLAVVVWGSVSGAAREATRLARAQGVRIKLLVPRLLYPVAEELYRGFFQSVQGGLVVEQSHQGQLYRLLRMYVDVPRGVEPFCRSGANPIASPDVLDRILKLAFGLQSRRQAEFAPQE